MIETLTVTAAPATTPVSVADMLIQCRVDSDDPNASALLPGYIAAATALVESTLKMSLITRSYAWTFDYFPNTFALTPWSLIPQYANSQIYPYTSWQTLYVPKPPLVSVDSIVYQSPTSGTLTLDPTTYTVRPGTPGRIAPNPGTVFPITYSNIGCVTVNFTAGFGTLATSVPPQAIQAIKLIAGDWFLAREDSSTGGVSKDAQRLLNSLKWGFY